MGVDAISALNPTGGAAYAGAGRNLAAVEENARKAQQAADDAKLRDACKGFEAMFLDLMYKKMRDTVPDNPLFGTSNGEKIMQSMLDSEMAKEMAEAGGIGLADLIYDRLTQENEGRIAYQAHLEEMKNYSRE